MSFLPPSTINTGGPWGGLHYQHSSNGHYDLMVNGSVSPGQSIEFTDTSGTLTLNVNPATGGGSTPAYFAVGSGSLVSSGTVSAGNSITFYSATNAVKGTITVPDFYTGGGGTSTEGSSNPSGSFYFNSQSQLVFVVNSTSPSSDGNIVYKIFRRTVNQVMGHAYTVTHSNGSPTEFSIGLDLSLYDRWELRVESSTALVDSATMSVYSTAPKKVFCNFW